MQIGQIYLMAGLCAVGKIVMIIVTYHHIYIRIKIGSYSFLQIGSYSFLQQFPYFSVTNLLELENYLVSSPR